MSLIPLFHTIYKKAPFLLDTFYVDDAYRCEKVVNKSKVVTFYSCND